MFVVTFLVAVGMSWLTVTIQNQRRQKVIAEEIVNAGEWVTAQPTWLGRFLHDDSLAKITEVRLFGLPANDDLLVGLRGLNQLQWLSLYGDRITDDELAHLRCLTRLEHLDLLHTAVTDMGLMSLQGMNQLRELSLDGTKVSDDGLPHLPKVAAIQSLDLSRTRVTDRGLKHLKNLTALHRLCLVGTQVTDQGLRDIQGLNGLKEVDLRLTGVTTDGEESSKRRYPVVWSNAMVSSDRAQNDGNPEPTPTDHPNQRPEPPANGGPHK